MEEEWRDIEGYEGCYQVSNIGRVKSLSRAVRNGKGTTRKIPERIRKPQDHSHGYLFVALHESEEYFNFYIHRLVALHFIANPKGLPEVNHKNLDRTDNRVENLEWVTHAENKAHASINNPWTPEGRSSVRLDWLKVLEIRNLLQLKVLRKQISTLFGVCVGSINSIATGKQWANPPDDNPVLQEMLISQLRKIEASA
jgi:hypothetical protein